MKRFYMLRHEDVHNNSGIGVVAEGIVFDGGYGAMTWIGPRAKRTVTTFDSIVDIKGLHGHEGKTEIIVEDQDNRFYDCQKTARELKTQQKLSKKKAKKQ